MKQKIFLFLFLALLTAANFAQTDAEDIKKTVQNYFQAVEQKDYVQFLDFIYPEIFDKYSKEEILKSLKEEQNDSSFVYSIENTKIENISQVIEVNGVKYALVTYSYKLIFIFDEKENEPEEAQKLDIQMMLSVYRQIYGEEKVEYDEKNHKFIIIDTQKMYAIKTPEYQGWKFLEKTKDDESMKIFLPEQVLTQLK